MFGILCRFLTVFVSVVVLLSATETAQAKRVTLTFHVSTTGNDAWSGTRATPNRKRTDGPFSSLERAFSEVCTAAAANSAYRMEAVIELQAGCYEIKDTLRITNEELGSEGNSLTIRGGKGAEVRLVGGKRVEGFEPVSDPEVLAQLDESARGNVVQRNLRQLGIADLGEAGGGGLELFFNDQPMTVSRWPNEEFTKVTGLAGQSPIESHGIKGDSVGVINYEGDRQSRWVAEKDPWAHGYWFWDWSEQRQRIESIDAEKHILTLAKPYHQYGYRLNQWYYGFNLFCEIDSPGEWYLDRTTGMLYFWPPSPVEHGRAVVSVISTVFSFKDISHVTIENLTIEACRGHA
ncbi:MAG TPA: hypothetical protein PKH07_15855, partial [bacterium]|nr:hypothetical protein [bacterium]